MMINCLSLVIIFIKRTDYSREREFLGHHLESVSEGLGAGDEKEPGPHTDNQENIDNLLDQESQQTQRNRPV